jgi:ParB family transcriptional regulator, chromosome partitioning protein
MTMDTETNDFKSLTHDGVGESGPTVMVPAMPIDRLSPAPWNPRKHFDEAALTELAADIAARGILQALVVRDVGMRLEIVCGHRRYLAAQRAGLTVVPVVHRVLDDKAALECAISENGQREGLHPLEEADGFGVLHTTHGVSVEDIATRFGVSTKLVYQRLSLAKLCDEGRDALAVLLRVDAKAIEKRVRDEAAKKKPAPDAPAPKKGAAKASSKKPAAKPVAKKARAK